MSYVNETTNCEGRPTHETFRAEFVQDVVSPVQEAAASILDNPRHSPGITLKNPSYSNVREGVMQSKREERIIVHKMLKHGFTVVSSIPKDTPEEREHKNNDMITRAFELLESMEETALF